MSATELIAAQYAAAAKNKDTWGSVIYNACDYGVKDDGTDQTANLAKVSATVKAAGGGVIYFPPGNYVGKLVAPAHTTVRGAGKGITTLKLPNASNDAVIRNEHIGDSEWGTDKFIRVESITIDGNYQNQTFPATLKPSGTAIGSVRAGDVTASGGDAYYNAQKINVGWYEIISGIYLKGVDFADVVDCEVNNCFHANIWYNQSRWGEVSNNDCRKTFYQCGVSISGDLTRSGKVSIKTNRIYDSALDGINAVEQYLSVQDNEIFNSGSFLIDGNLAAAGIFLSWKSKYIRIANNLINGTSGQGIDGKAVTYATIIGNQISYTGLGGIWIYSDTSNMADVKQAQHNRIIGNNCWNNGQKSTVGQNYGGIGVASFNSSTTTFPLHNTVTGNECWDDQVTKTQEYGIVVINTDFAIVQGNDCHDNLTATSLADVTKNYLTNLNANSNINSDIKIPGQDGKFASGITIDMSGKTGFAGRHAMDILGSSDNSTVEIFSNKGTIRFVDGPGKLRIVQFASPAGDTANRPSEATATVNEWYIDTQIGKLIRYEGAGVWKDTMGNTV